MGSDDMDDMDDMGSDDMGSDDMGSDDMGEEMVAQVLESEEGDDMYMGSDDMDMAEEAAVGGDDTKECTLPSYSQHWQSTVLDTTMAAGTMALSAASFTLGGPVGTYAANFAK